MKSWKASFIFDYNSMKLEIAQKKDTGKKHKDLDTKHSKQPMSQQRNQKGNKISCTNENGNARFRNLWMQHKQF